MNARPLVHHGRQADKQTAALMGSMTRRQPGKWVLAGWGSGSSCLGNPAEWPAGRMDRRAGVARQVDGCMDRQTDGHMDGAGGKQNPQSSTERLMDETDRQTDRHDAAHLLGDAAQ
jgi:hypothetical protein